ncbi:MAG: inositol monophosphatase [Deltaproteobacteria bacterium]|nr:inositol monophosphatase [Deltaproteobacteria bacterium]
MIPLEEFTDVATAACRRAGFFLAENFGRVTAEMIRRKKHMDYVTEMDLTAERMIIDTITASFPTHKIMAEETRRDTGEGYRWIIDPLDGTTNYIHGFPRYAVSIALEKDGELMVGTVYDPERDELFAAEKGRGATLNGRPIRVSEITDPTLALVGTGIPFRNIEFLDSYLDSLREITLGVSGVRRPGAAALDLADVACGRTDGFWEICLCPWDVAAGSLLITEGGGKCSSINGQSNGVESGHVAAGNPSVYAFIQPIVDKTLTPALARRSPDLPKSKFCR